MFSGRGCIGKNIFYLGDLGETSESHEYSVALLHSELAAYSEGGIRQDKENSKRNSICLNFNKKCQYTQKARPKELVSFNEELYLISVASDFKP